MSTGREITTLAPGVTLEVTRTGRNVVCAFEVVEVDAWGNVTVKIGNFTTTLAKGDALSVTVPLA